MVCPKRREPTNLPAFLNKHTKNRQRKSFNEDEHVYEKHVPPEWKKQFINLSGRITLLRWSIMFGAFGFLFNMLTVLGLYLSEIFIARVIFGSCCLSMIISIIFFIREIHISTNALKLHMSDMDIYE